MNRTALLFFAALFVSACTEIPPAPPSPDPKTQMGALETRIAVLVEEERLKLDP